MTAPVSLKDAPPGRYRVVGVEAEEKEDQSLLDNLGLKPGDLVEVLHASEREIPAGPLLLKLPTGKVVLGRGMAQLIQVQMGEKILCLNELFPGENGKIVAVLGGEKNLKLFERLHLKPGVKVWVESVFQDELLYLAIDGKEEVFGEGEAAKIWVRKGQQLIQPNFLKPGESALVEDILGGDLVVENLRKKGVIPGKTITFLRKESSQEWTVVPRQVVGAVHNGKEFFLCQEVASAILLEKI